MIVDSGVISRVEMRTNFNFHARDPKVTKCVIVAGLVASVSLVSICSKSLQLLRAAVGNRTELTCLEVGWPVEERAKPSIGSKSCMVNFNASPELTFMENVLLGLPTGGRCDGGEGGCHHSQIKPYDENLRRYGNDWPLSGYTMIGRVRLQNVRCAIEEVNWNRVPGDIVELGVWRGAMIMAALVMR
jgi:Macrocin-O-methyltransferase (TylF)